MKRAQVDKKPKTTKKLGKIYGLLAECLHGFCWLVQPNMP
jgi:hypothetical protein